MSKDFVSCRGWLYVLVTIDFDVEQMTACTIARAIMVVEVVRTERSLVAKDLLYGRATKYFWRTPEWLGHRTRRDELGDFCYVVKQQSH